MEPVLAAISVLADPLNMALLIGAVLAGIVIGAIPGLTSAVAIGLLIPFTFGFTPETAFILLLGIYVGSMYGGSIPAILMNLPGTPSAAVTTQDGFPMTKQGKAGDALGISIFSGTIGGVISCFFLVFLSLQLAQVALRFGGPEYFALCTFAIVVVFVFSGESALKGVVAAGLGLLLSTIGIDPIAPYPRFTFDIPEIAIGLPIVPATIGMFCVAEAFRMLETPNTRNSLDSKFAGMGSVFRKLPKFAPCITRSSILGTIVGILPGTGATVASYLSYNLEKFLSKTPERFGKGAPEGVSAAESANNACSGGTMIPLLTLGIPGDINTLLLIGAMFVHGLVPGPTMFTDKIDLVYVIFGAMILSNLLILVLGVLFTKWVAKIATVEKRYLIPIVLVIAITGPAIGYGHVYYFWVAIFFGLVGYFCEKAGFPVLAIAMGLILGPILESNLRSSLMLPGVDVAMFFTRPISGLFLGAAIILLLYGIRREAVRWRQRRAALAVGGAGGAK